MAFRLYIWLDFFLEDILNMTHLSSRTYQVYADFENDFRQAGETNLCRN